jgi:hypothetical protein
VRIIARGRYPQEQDSNPNTGGTTKHQTSICAYRTAAAVQPNANTAMLIDIASNRAP